MILDRSVNFLNSGEASVLAEYTDVTKVWVHDRFQYLCYLFSISVPRMNDGSFCKAHSNMPGNN